MINPSQLVTLPCGRQGFNEQDICGFPSYRCLTCHAVYGSISCPCTPARLRAPEPKAKGPLPATPEVTP